MITLFTGRLLTTLLSKDAQVLVAQWFGSWINRFRRIWVRFLENGRGNMGLLMLTAAVIVFVKSNGATKLILITDKF